MNSADSIYAKISSKDGHYEQYCPFFYGKKEVNEDSKK